MTNINEIYQSILDGDANTIGDKVQTAIDQDLEVSTILNEGMVAAMSEVGRLFEAGEYFVPEMLISARAMKAGLFVLQPYLVDADVQSAGKVAIGTVKGDLHDIGKNLVAMMLEGAAFEIVDLGVDVSPETFIAAVKNENVNIVALSALLTTTMPQMIITINALKEANLRDNVKIIIGGAPVTEEYAEKIGADGYAPDASRAVALSNILIA